MKCYGIFSQVIIAEFFVIQEYFIEFLLSIIYHVFTVIGIFGQRKNGMKKEKSTEKKPIYKMGQNYFTMIDLEGELQWELSRTC